MYQIRIHVAPLLSLLLVPILFIIALPHFSQKQQIGLYNAPCLASACIRAENGSFTYFGLPTIMLDKTTKGSSRCDLLHW